MNRLTTSTGLNNIYKHTILGFIIIFLSSKYYSYKYTYILI